VAALADARRALASGDAAEALRLLDVHDRRFAPPALSAEATILRIEALVAVGRLDEARGLATGFVTAHPDSPYAQRVASLVRAAGAVGNAGADTP
jgi:outer membrane protein assembly factor BamD (BamD/ComL family)